MANARRSSRSTARSASTAAADPEHDSANKDASDNQNDSAAIDSTHQAADTPHEKQDQKLEGSDPDLIPSSVSETSTADAADQLAEAATTPIQKDLQEQELEPKPSKDESTPDHDHNSHPHPVVNEDEHASGPVDQEDPQEPVHSLHLQSHIKGVPGHGHHATTAVEAEDDASAEELNGTAPSLSGMTEAEPAQGLETMKHGKRAVEEDSNTIADETQDYLAGAYKSPFRHTSKSEKAGKEER
ncbi:hypothetical protein EC968_003886 [Mortierella alpina]|nr:hypothetical protein EC968_003886 [Mortierella alpina]